MSVLSKSKRDKIYSKTSYRCSCCGSYQKLTVDHFIPKWTRIVRYDIDNLIPMCEDCQEKKGCNFIALNELRFLSQIQKHKLMQYYQTKAKYLKKYVSQFGEFRTDGLLDVDRAKMILRSYDVYVEYNITERK